MITFIDEEKVIGAGLDWIQIESMQSDICTISIGHSISHKVDEGDLATYSCITYDVWRLHSFTKGSRKGDSFIMEWCADDDSHYQKCIVIDLGDEFLVDITETWQNKKEDSKKQYSYSVDHDTLVKAAREMYELYLSINKESIQ